MKRLGVFVLCVTLCVMLAGCFGTFPVTRSLHQLNTDLDDTPVVQQLVWLGLAPFYCVGLAADVLVANPLEFVTTLTDTRP